MTETKSAPQIAAVIPSYKVTEHILELLENIGPEVTKIYVVDDKCPDESGKFVSENCADPRVECLFNETNLGVGGAVLNGFMAAKQAGLDIAVKLDGDGQMDPKLVPTFISPIVEGRADYSKGNRFYTPESLSLMPTGRIIGNAILSFISKFSTGYWGVFDPTNGFIALDLRLMNAIPTEKIHKRYFFETDLLFRCNLARAKVIDIPMRALYADEVSNLKFGKEILPFMSGHLRNFFKRIAYTYFLRDFNVASIELLFGTLFVLFGAIYGSISLLDDGIAAAGEVMLAGLPILVGVQLLLSFLNYDMQLAPRDVIAPLLLDTEEGLFEAMGKRDEHHAKEKVTAN